MAAKAVRLLFALPVFASITPAYSACNQDHLIGYTLVAKKTVVGYIENGERKDEFSGCNFSRVLVFDDGTGLRCAEYNYDYSYRPDAFIYLRGSDIKACIDNEFYSLMSLR